VARITVADSQLRSVKEESWNTQAGLQPGARHVEQDSQIISIYKNIFLQQPLLQVLRTDQNYLPIHMRII
jgi:hypothetical protein